MATVLQDQRTRIGGFTGLVPAGLIVLRIALAPLLFLLCVRGGSPVAILAVLLASMLSDTFDGVIARRLSIATAPLRVWDSRADAWFFVWAGLAAWFTSPQIVIAYRGPLIAELFIQVGSYAYDLIRYSRIASLHAYSAKLWGFTLYLAFAALLGFHTGALIWVCFGAGLLSFADALAIKLTLPGWQHDILSFAHALRLRKESTAS